MEPWIRGKAVTLIPEQKKRGIRDLYTMVAIYNSSMEQNRSSQNLDRLVANLFDW